MNERTKPKGFGIAAMLTMLLLIGSISVAGASGDDYSAENFYVDEDTAWIHADVYLTEWIADETPGLEGWDGAKVQKDAVTVYDIHGTKLFYEFAVTKDGKAIGGMEIAASKVLGSSLRKVLLSPPMDRETAIQKAKKVAEKEYPGYNVQSTKSVCYSYPKQGVMVILAKPGDKEERTVIIDPYTSRVVPLKEPGMEGEPGVWSIYDRLPAEERAERVEKWSNAAKFVANHSVNGNSAEGDGSLDAEQMKAVEYNYFFGLDPGSHKVIVTYGKLPELETEEQKQNWSYSIGELVESLKIELASSYMYPNGKMMTCGSNSRGYFVILFYENLTKTDPLIDEIYAMIDEKARNMGIQEVSVEFGYGVYYYEYETDDNLPEPERTSVEEFMMSGRGIYNPRVIATYGTPLEFENREQWQNWADDDIYHVIIEGLNYQHQQGSLDSYFYPAGPAIGYGIAINGYITVTIYENLTVEKPLLDEIYAIIDEEAKKNGIHEVPVMFTKEGLIVDDVLLVEDSNNETSSPDETSSESVPGFGLLGGLIAFLCGWIFIFRRGQA